MEGGEKEEEEKEGYWKQSKMIYFAKHMAHTYTLGTQTTKARGLQ